MADHKLITKRGPLFGAQRSPGPFPNARSATGKGDVDDLTGLGRRDLIGSKDFVFCQTKSLLPVCLMRFSPWLHQALGRRVGMRGL